MSGPTAVVQIDETNIVRRKYNRGRIARKDSIIGGIKTGTRMVFCEVIDKPGMATFDAIVQKYVAPGRQPVPRNLQLQLDDGVGKMVLRAVQSASVSKVHIYALTTKVFVT
ncbi:unnamed protein product [Nippostrongylus brasiliensis]|uniref:DDE-1 domain-containing protein n=1 Tax=Nippostrongylus brasiliensis TaxID=27835 RepID=A0A0N4XZ14_NIPBR|nr:unnamed protein product [Nippostrongylus brasiliensis]